MVLDLVREKTIQIAFHAFVQVKILVIHLLLILALACRCHTPCMYVHFGIRSAALDCRRHP